jgi:hypothetical protein
MPPPPKKKGFDSDLPQLLLCHQFRPEALARGGTTCSGVAGGRRGVQSGRCVSLRAWAQ